jgi:hypothetical protein
MFTGDKVLMGLLIMTLYLGIGDDFNPGNYINMAAVLFMWITMPAFGAAAYVPSLVLGELLTMHVQGHTATAVPEQLC